MQEEYTSEPNPQKDPAPALTYFHIPLPEFKSFDEKDVLGVKQEGIGSPWYNSGFFKTMVGAGDVKAALVGHDHKNDFCGKLSDVHLCYAGGFGYHAYGKAGWPRRARVVSAYLEKTDSGEWGGVESINTWKRLDDEGLTIEDYQALWNKGGSTGKILMLSKCCSLSVVLIH